MRHSMTKQDANDFRACLKRGKILLQQGENQRAEFFLLRAYEHSDDLPKSERSGKRAFVLHRLAEVSIKQGEPMLARRRFREALKLSDQGNALGHARIKRDHGEFLRRQGETEAGRREVETALKIMESSTSQTPRLTKELLVTEGILARFDLSNPKKRSDAVETQRLIARQLSGYKKSQYELAIWRFMIEEALPLYSLERVDCIRRAIFLSFKLGNYKKAGEYISLLGGPPLRSAYTRVVR